MKMEEGDDYPDYWNPGKVFDYFGMRRSRWVLWLLSGGVTLMTTLMLTLTESNGKESLNIIGGCVLMPGFVVSLVTIWLDTREERKMIKQ
ncbi:MAG: hypothetical protein ACTII3_06625 [Galactobacter sp.]